MRASTPIMLCDDDLCSEWELDFYEQTASSVGGVRITATKRAPGWVSTRLADFCPEHASGATTSPGGLT